jgi:predicted alpha-1,6-mannanase (GH76 family)
MINDKHMVNDGLNDKCENNQKTTWTYNQGVILGGLTALYKADHHSSLLVEANGIAEAALSNLTDSQGILHDTCEPKCGADGTQFKGIFVRNLRALDEISRRPRYRSFVMTNADSIWSQTRPPDYHLGEVWAAPFGNADASTQSSALDALVTAAQLARGSHLNSPL